MLSSMEVMELTVLKTMRIALDISSWPRSVTCTIEPLMLEVPHEHTDYARHKQSVTGYRAHIRELYPFSISTNTRMICQAE